MKLFENANHHIVYINEFSMNRKQRASIVGLLVKGKDGKYRLHSILKWALLSGSAEKDLRYP